MPWRLCMHRHALGSPQRRKAPVHWVQGISTSIASVKQADLPGILTGALPEFQTGRRLYFAGGLRAAWAGIGVLCSASRAIAQRGEIALEVREKSG